MQLQAVIDELEAIAPPALAEPWDKVGLHLGDTDDNITRALIGIDLTEAVLDEATDAGCELIVAYHPPIFQPIERLTPTTWKQRLLVRAIRAGVAVYSPHTALDSAPGGVNDWLAQGVGPGRVTPIEPARGDTPVEFKLVTFVPLDHVDTVRAALSDAGAGRIGDYDQCSFGLRGEGTFRGGEGSDPFLGEAGRFETVQEMRLEMVTPAGVLARVVAALLESHPYEEVAYDLYRLEPAPRTEQEPVAGQGRLIELDEPATLSTLAERVKVRLGAGWLQIIPPAATEPDATYRRVALCAGAGGSVLEHADADVWFTGEMRHHDMLDAAQRGIAVILAGHTETERPYLRTYRDRLAAACGGVDWRVSEADRSPIQAG